MVDEALCDDYEEPMEMYARDEKCKRREVTREKVSVKKDKDSRKKKK